MVCDFKKIFNLFLKSFLIKKGIYEKKKKMENNYKQIKNNHKINF